MVFLGVRPSSWNYARGLGLQQFTLMCKEMHVSKNYAKIRELVHCGAGKEGGQGFIATEPSAGAIVPAVKRNDTRKHLDHGLFDFRDKVVLDLSLVRGWTEFAALSGAARKVVVVDSSDLPPMLSSAVSEGVVTQVTSRVKDVMMALNCQPGRSGKLALT